MEQFDKDQQENLGRSNAVNVGVYLSFLLIAEQPVRPLCAPMDMICNSISAPWKVARLRWLDGKRQSPESDPPPHNSMFRFCLEPNS